jgi:Tfp pilus assembly protein PilF
MNKFRILGLTMIGSFVIGHAQDLDSAKKAFDAEKFESAKTILKSILKSKPNNGIASFILGNVYMKQSYADSAKVVFQNGLKGNDGAKFNYIGLGQIDLNSGNRPGAQSNFDLAIKDAKKKGIEELTYVGRAYMNQTKPDFKGAITVLTKASLIDSQNVQLQLALGDAYYGDSNQNEAYKAYRNAYSIDNTLIRAKMQLGVILKGAKAYEKAIESFNEVIAVNPNYGPVYRELAETHYKWGRNVPSKYAESMKTAIGFYDKYMSLTDYSLTSRMRHADFLILVKDYKALEVEATKLKQLDKVNPRIYRYLGYSAYENGNVDVAITSLETFISNPVNVSIGYDYYYLGIAKIKKATSADGLSVNSDLFNVAILDIKKAVEMDYQIVEELNPIGKKLFTQKLYKEASSVFEFGSLAKPESKNYSEDNTYYGLSLYYSNNNSKVLKPDPIALQKADVAFANVISNSPKYQESYLSRARVNSLLGNDELMAKYYQDYIVKVTDKGTEELAKPANKTKLIEAYNSIAANLAKTDIVKAKEFLNKTLSLDPANAYALSSLKALK